MLLNDCVVDGVVVDIIDNGVMDMKLEIAAAEEVLPPMMWSFGLRWCRLQWCCLAHHDSGLFRPKRIDP